MTLEQLQQFYETARRGHLGQAAASLRLSPSAISYSINCLESELGVKLFEKRGKRIFLTDAGERLLEKIPAVQTSMEELKSHVETGQLVLKGHYVIGATHLIASQMVTEPISVFRTLHPDVTIELLSLRSSDVVGGVLDGSLNAGICFSPQKNPMIASRILTSGHLKIYVRKNHPILKVARPLSKIGEYGAVLPKAFAGIDVCEAHPVFSEFQIAPKPKFAFDAYDVAIRTVEQTNEWGFFPDWIDTLKGTKVVQLTVPKKWSAPYTISAIWQKGRRLDSGLSAILAQFGEQE